MLRKKIKQSTKKFAKGGGLAASIGHRKRTAQYKSKAKKKAAVGDEKRAKRQASKDQKKEIVQTLTADKHEHAGMGDVEHMDVDAFLSGDFLNNDVSDSEDQQALAEFEAAEEAPSSDEGGEDSEEDVEEEGEPDQEKLKQEMKEHREELARLRETDPEFHKHLEQEAANLLDFQDEDSEAEEEDAGKKKGSKGTVEWFKHLERRTLTSQSAFLKVLRMFRSAVKAGDENEGAKDDKKGTDYDANRVENYAVNRRVIAFCLKNCAVLFRKHLGLRPSGAVDESTEGKEQSVTHAKKWDALSRHVRRYLETVVHLISKEQSAPSALAMIAATAPLKLFFYPFVKVSILYIKTLLKAWGEGMQGDTEAMSVRIEAFLRLRDFVLDSPPHKGLLEVALKGIYLTYVRNSKFVTPATLPPIRLMANCVAELYGVDEVVGYQHAFVYVRQLAIHLRNAIIAKGKDSAATVCNWQFLNCLRVWSLILARYAGVQQSQDSRNAIMHKLVYPFVQVCLGVLQLQRSSQYVPLQLQIAEFLNEVAAATNVYVPLSPHLLAVLQIPEMRKSGSKSNIRVPKFGCILKVSKAVLETSAFQSLLLTKTLRVFLEHLAVYSHAVSFPEMIVPTQVLLQRFVKKASNSTLKKQVQTFAQKLVNNASYVSNKRRGELMSPKMVKSKNMSVITTFASKDGKTQSPLQRFVALQGEDTTSAIVDSENEVRAENDKKTKQAEKRKEKKNKLKLKRKAAKGGDEDEEEEDEEEDAPKAKKQKKQKKHKQFSEAEKEELLAKEGGIVGAKDDVQDFDMDEFVSSSEEEEGDVDE